MTLGLLFAACASGAFSLRLPGVVPVALLISSVVAVFITPIAVWALRTGTKNLYIYAPILWIILAAYEILVVPGTGPYGTYGLFFVSVGGLLILGLIPKKNTRLE